MQWETPTGNRSARWSMHSPFAAVAQQPKPNILVIMGDDIGYCEHQRLQPRPDGLPHPNIDRHRQRRRDPDRLLRPAILHRRPRCVYHRPEPDAHRLTQSRAPGGERGVVGEGSHTRRSAQTARLHDRTIRQEPSRRTATSSCPTAHGFDVFFGNLYHLNAEDEPEHPDYPKNLEFKLRFGPRGVLRCTATLTETPAKMLGSGSVGKAELRRHRPASPRSA